MRKGLLLATKFCLAAMLFFVSCSKPEIYEPMVASAMIRDIQISITDPSGNDLLSNEAFTSNLSIYGTLSKKELPFEIIKIKPDEVEKNYLLFRADLPDEKGMTFNADKTEGKGLSSVEIKTNGLSAKLLFDYKYTALITNEPVYGNASIRIESIEYKGKKVTRSNNQINSDFILNFVVENNVLALK